MYLMFCQFFNSQLSLEVTTCLPVLHMWSSSTQGHIDPHHCETTGKQFCLLTTDPGLLSHVNHKVYPINFWNDWKSL